METVIRFIPDRWRTRLLLKDIRHFRTIISHKYIPNADYVHMRKKTCYNFARKHVKSQAFVGSNYANML